MQNVITLAGYVALLVRFSGLAVVGLVLAAVPATLVEMKFSTTAFRLRNWRSPEARRMNYLEHVLANDNYAKEVKLFGLGPVLLDRYKELEARRFYPRGPPPAAVQRAGWAWGLSPPRRPSPSTARTPSWPSRAARGALTLGNMVLYVMAFRQGQQAFQSILSAIGGMYEDNLYMSRTCSTYPRGHPRHRAPRPGGPGGRAPRAARARARHGARGRRERGG